MGLSPTTRSGGPGIIYHYAGSYDPTTGKADWRGGDRTQELKKSYAAEIIKSQAKRYGWQLRQSTTDRYAYTITKR